MVTFESLMSFRKLKKKCLCKLSGLLLLAEYLSDIKHDQILISRHAL